MVKFSTAAELVPLLVTAADVPAAPVVTVPTDTVAAAHCAPVGPAPPADASNVHAPDALSGWLEELLSAAMAAM